MVMVVVVILVSSGDIRTWRDYLASASQFQGYSATAAELIFWRIVASAQAAGTGDGQHGLGWASGHEVRPCGLHFQAFDGETRRCYGFRAWLRTPHLGLEVLEKVVDRVGNGTTRFVVRRGGNTAGWVLLLIVQNDLPEK